MICDVSERYGAKCREPATLQVRTTDPRGGGGMMTSRCGPHATELMNRMVSIGGAFAVRPLVGRGKRGYELAGRW